MNKLNLPSGENILLAAFRAVSKNSNADYADIVNTYGDYFVTSAQPSKGTTKNFERFSLIDHNIRTVIQSTTLKI